MAHIQYRTQANISPQGKSRVWFCAHPQDYETYRDPVIDEILKAHSCAVYFDGEPNAPYSLEDFSADLRQMNLFVMPVTTRLLTTQNRALDMEFAFAVKHHIPVLPLMQESGLEELFNTKCGTIHFLDKNLKDATSLSYKEKLQKYLSFILVGDALAEQIRNAFDAYIFLSYRKKDRKYAQELMRLIHENEFCRDIAIWYDEFLVPGEDFNHSIASAMEKSKLFALAVTPNLLEDGNYVMNVEYKEAKRAEMPILPAELIPTDRGELSSKFAGIPTCTDAYDQGALSTALLDALESIVLRENDSDPRHNFFIGMAYLSGIDVEVNHQRALNLIESAAEAGLPEAMQKLVRMYRDGEGVKQDYEKALDWQKRYVELLREQYSQGDRTAFEPYLQALLMLGDDYAQLNHVDLAVNTYALLGDAANANEQLCDASLAREMRFLADARRGDIYLSQGEAARANEFYSNYLEMAQLFAAMDGSYSAQWHLFNAYQKDGDVSLTMGALGNAEDAYESAYNVAMKISSITRDERAVETLYSCQKRLGQILTAFGDLDKAKTHYENAMSLADELDAMGAQDAVIHLAESNLAYGHLLLNMNKPQEGLRYTQRAIDYAVLFDKEKNTFASHRTVALCYKEHGDALARLKRTDEAQESFDNALFILLPMVSEMPTLQVRKDLVQCYLSMYDLAMEGEDVALAEENLVSAAKYLSPLTKGDFLIEIRQLVASFFTRTGDLRLRQNRLEAAYEQYEKAAYHWKFMKECYDAPEYTAGFADISAKQADAQKGIKRLWRLLKAQRMTKKLVWSCPNAPDYFHLLQTIQGKMGLGGKSNWMSIGAILLSVLLFFVSEYRRLILCVPLAFDYWLMAVPGMLLYLWGANQIFGNRILARYRAKSQHKRREDRSTYFDAKCHEISMHFLLIMIISLVISTVLHMIPA